MKMYQYQIIRYLHDRVTGEFVNVGIVMYSPEFQYLDCRVVDRCDRLTAFFDEADGDGILELLSQFKVEILNMREQLTENQYSINEITSRILPDNDSSVVLTDMKKGIDFDLSKCLGSLFRLLVRD
jgi:hypothetical protein